MKKSVLQNLKSAFNLSYLALIVLFSFMIATSFMTVNYMAKYTSSDNGNDGARIADFDVRVLDITTTELTISENSADANYTFSVENRSEVGIKYSVDIVFDENLPSNVTISMGGVSYTGDGSKKSYTFNGYELPVGENKKEHILVVSAEVTENKYESNVCVLVNAEQIN